MLIFCVDDQEITAKLDYVLLLSLVILSKLIIFVLFYYIVTFNFFFLNTRSLLVPYAYVSFKSLL